MPTPVRTAKLGVAVALALVVTTGCTATEPTGAPSASPVADASFCDELRPAVGRVADEMGTPGAVVLVRAPELGGDCFVSVGTRDIEQDQPISLNDQFRIGSNTKTMTGTVILQLVQEGALSLDDPVSDYRDGVPGGERITIAQLLNMRSGLEDYSALPELSRSMDETPGRVWTADEVLALSFDQPAAFPPGEGYLYSNANTVLLGLIIEDITGALVEESFRTRIFEPLGMDRTVLPTRTSGILPDQHSRGYVYGTISDFIADNGVLSAEDAADAASGVLVPNDVTDMNPSWGWAAGAGISTTEDLARYVKALVGGELLDEQMQQERLASVLPVNPDDPAGPAYGLAIAKYGGLYGHTGELPGYNSFMGYDPERDITVIAWANMMTGPDGRLTANVLSQAVIDLLYPAS